MARFLVQTIPNKLPELLINLSSQGPHLMGATLSTLLRAVHPGTIAMTDFRQRLRPKVLTRHLGDLGILHVISCSDEHSIGIRVNSVGTGPRLQIPWCGAFIFPKRALIFPTYPLANKLRFN